MKVLFKIIAVVLALVLLIASVVVILSVDEENEGKTVDSTPPSIDSISGDISGTAGKITTISATFSDNVNVDSALIFYKSANAAEWDSSSIIAGSFDIQIPTEPLQDWYYYVTVNDAASNGPIGSPSVDGSVFYTITVRKDVENLVHNVFVEEATGSWC